VRALRLCFNLAPWRWRPPAGKRSQAGLGDQSQTKRDSRLDLVEAGQAGNGFLELLFLFKPFPFFN
jgi:hypothetical protein